LNDNKLLKGPALSEPSALPKIRFPVLVGLVGRIGARSRNVWQIDIAFSPILVLTKRRVDGLCELGAIRFVDIAGVYPN
jgi:hypothetical protein